MEIEEILKNKKLKMLSEFQDLEKKSQILQAQSNQVMARMARLNVELECLTGLETELKPKTEE